MYLPKHFLPREEPEAFALMEQYSFATLISCVDNVPFMSHLPLLVKRDGKMLLGHMARANPHWRILKENPKVTILFHGPHTYVTPSWYVSGRDVPTWNYAVVHVSGRARLIEDFAGLTKILAELTTRFEASNATPWQFALPDDLSEPDALGRAIVGFEVEITEIQAKFKLSQNRSQADQQGILNGLGGRTDDQSKAIYEMMNQTS